MVVSDIWHWRRLVKVGSVYRLNHDPSSLCGCNDCLVAWAGWTGVVAEALFGWLREGEELAGG